MVELAGDKNARTSTKVYEAAASHIFSAPHVDLIRYNGNITRASRASISPQGVSDLLIWPSELEVSRYGPISLSASWLTRLPVRTYLVPLLPCAARRRGGPDVILSSCRLSSAATCSALCAFVRCFAVDIFALHTAPCHRQIQHQGTTRLSM